MVVAEGLGFRVYGFGGLGFREYLDPWKPKPG